MKKQSVYIGFKKEQCCGCAACESICPVHAITMDEDREGFLYPNVDKGACLSCGKCVDVCSFRNETTISSACKIYGVKHTDLSVRESSRSGAAFVGLSNVVLQNNGVIYGAAFDENLDVSHQRADTQDERNLMKKVKYVQSNTVGVFGQVEMDLKNGLTVLFSGTACQVAGIQMYLNTKKVDTSRLFCVDIICHGVPSPMIWRRYVQQVELMHKRKVLSAEFRDKAFGWDSHYESFCLEGRSKKVVRRDYADMFSSGVILRPSCYFCPFASANRCADITLGDFWGIDKIRKSFNDNRGVSLVLVNTSKGAELLKQSREEFEAFECSLEQVLQPRLQSPSVRPVTRELFWNDFYTVSFDKLVKKYTAPPTGKEKAKKQLRQILYKLGFRNRP